MLFWIRDLEALKHLCALNKHSDDRKNMRLGNMKQLLGIDTGAAAQGSNTSTAGKSSNVSAG